MYIAQECSQKWYRRSAWRGTKFRTFNAGFAIGPIMFIQGSRQKQRMK